MRNYKISTEMEKKRRIKFVKCSKLMFFNKNTQCIKPPYAFFFIYLPRFNAFVPLGRFYKLALSDCEAVFVVNLFVGEGV